MSSRTPVWPGATLLGRLGPAARDVLVKAGTLVRFPPQRVILRQGDEEQHSLLLLDSYVKVLASAEGGYEGLLGIRVGGDLVGEMAALDGGPRSATVVACGPVPARLITRPTLIGIMSRHADIQVQITRMISERLRFANRRRIEFRAHDAPTRVGRVLVELAERYGHQTAEGQAIAVRLTQSELASLVGVALPTVEKALRALHRGGMIQCRYRQMIVTDLPRLRTVTKMTGENPY